MYSFIGTALFFVPGFLLSFKLFPATSVRIRILVTVLLSVVSATIVGSALFFSPYFTRTTIIGLWCMFSIVLFIFNFRKKTTYRTEWGNDGIVLCLAIVSGVAVRVLFYGGIKNYASPYDYSGAFLQGIPDVGFYTGMIKDHANYFGLRGMQRVYTFIANAPKVFNYLLFVSAYVLSVHELVYCVRGKTLARLAAVLCAFGPFEIFHSSKEIIGHPLAYVAFLMLFLYYVREAKGFFWLMLGLAITMALTYYTGTLVILIGSIGFVIALIVQALMQASWSLTRGLSRGFANEKVQGYLIIAGILLFYLFFLSRMSAYTAALIHDSVPAELTFFSGTTRMSMLYKDPAIFGFSALSWQIIFFLGCGLTFIGALIVKRKKWGEFQDLFIISIPVFCVSLAFLYADYPMRAFDYGAPFFILFLFIPKRFFVSFSLVAAIFVLLSTAQLVQDKKIFFEISDGEREASQWVSANLKHRVFADEPFVNQLIARRFFNLTGLHDFDPVVFSLFYADTKEEFLGAIEHLKQNERIWYCVITQRMRDTYILMLDYPQGAIQTEHYFKELFPIVYDNGDVTIYAIQ
jgi:hypothetical protein